MHYYELDSKKLTDTIKASRFKSISKLAQSIGVHRNTISHFLKEGVSVIPESLTKLFSALGKDAREYIILKDGGRVDIAFIVDCILDLNPKCCVVLFGSRARGSYRKFSDYDIGIYSREGINHETYCNTINKVEEITEDFPYLVQVVNLNRADQSFMNNIRSDMIFLGGRMTDWLEVKNEQTCKLN